MKLKEIRYSLLAEGIAEYFAINLIINKIVGKNNYKFIQSSAKIAKNANPSKSKVYANIKTFANNSLATQEQLFIVGVDLDEPDFEHKKWEKEEQKIKNSLPQKTNKVIIFIPVKAFDYWLLYQKYQIDKNLPKPPANSLESKKKDQTKEELYGNKSPNRAKIEDTCRKILEKIDLEELSKQSKSFKRFYEEIISFIKS